MKPKLNSRGAALEFGPIPVASNGFVRSTAPGEEMYRWASDLFPIHRSLMGEGNRTTLRYLKGLLPDLELFEVSSGTKVFDWRIPDEWTIRDAYVCQEGKTRRLIDLRKSNLHVVGYSTPVDAVMSLEELQPHLYSLPEMPDAIPYVTSYYQPQWGFCLTHAERAQLTPGNYRVVIDSSLAPGSLSYAELILPGQEDNEVLLSTYVCHPSMANNELSGPVVTTALARWLATIKNRRFTYRIVFAPETLGAITYLHRNLSQMKAKTVAGFVVTCVGDDRAYSVVHSRMGDTLADRVATHVMKRHAPDYQDYSYLHRGSDERQYCSPGVDLPVVSILRSLYGSYPEYHTSKDNLDLISPRGLHGAFEALRKCIVGIEGNYRYQVNHTCEPQLGRRGFYPTTHTPQTQAAVQDMMNVLAYADGEHDVFQIADRIGIGFEECLTILDKLYDAQVITRSAAGQVGAAARHSKGA
ncbi:MAG: DUF4910 domain-containing protein [Acidobacteriota bacterium]